MLDLPHPTVFYLIPALIMSTPPTLKILFSVPNTLTSDLATPFHFKRLIYPLISYFVASTFEY